MFVIRFDAIQKEDIVDAGGKGANLGELCRIGMPVPPGFVVTTAGYRHFVAANDLQEPIMALATAPQVADPTAYAAVSAQIHDLFMAGAIPADLAAAIRTAYAELTEGCDSAVAVRSSATAEDLPQASFAGQQETYLNVGGAAALLEAVKQCWASLWTARAMAYRARQDIDPATVSLAVVVQHMVAAEAAGILFTANPANGQRGQAVIDAAWGLGEAVVGGQVTPDHWVVDKRTGRILSHQIADKAVMTVHTDHGTQEQPVPAAQRRQAAISDAVAAKLAAYGVQIENHYQTPMDIEWAVTEGQIAILQARPITALPEPMADLPTEWPVADPGRMYYRASIIEQLPDPLSPLFATLAARPVVETLKNVFRELLGEFSLSDDAFQFVTINGYGYITLRFTTREAWQITLAALVVLPVIFQHTRKRWQDRDRPRYLAVVKAWQAKSSETLTATELLSGARELLYRGAEYYTGVQIVIPNAITSEVSFTEFYNRLVKRHDDPPAQTFLLGFDSLPIRAEKSLYDVAMWSRAQPALADTLIQTPSNQAAELLAREQPPAGVAAELWQTWRTRFHKHLEQFGHTIYNLDFLNPVPADDPAPLFETFKFYLQGRGADPHKRQQEAVVKREQATQATLARLDPVRRAMFRKLLAWAQDIVPLREDALADVGLGWPLLRRLLFELGHRLIEAGAIARPDDIFWLEKDELAQATAALDAGQTQLDSFAAAITERKMQWRGQKRVTPPQLLPEGVKFMGLNIERWLPAVSDAQAGATIRGVAAGAGQVTAAARVLHGPEDFGAMQPGDVLVASITTPAWTPLFALASAVVTDIGGPMSHGSIVAREYGIPAVMGTGVATKRIRSGQSIRVDGDAGTVTLLDEGVAEAPGEAAEEAGFPAKKAVFAALAAVALGLALWRRKRRRRGKAMRSRWGASAAAGVRSIT
jgi:pyruvate,water dikinase